MPIHKRKSASTHGTMQLTAQTGADSQLQWGGGTWVESAHTRAHTRMHTSSNNTHTHTHTHTGARKSTAETENNTHTGLQDKRKEEAETETEHWLTSLACCCAHPPPRLGHLVLHHGDNHANGRHGHGDQGLTRGKQQASHCICSV